VAGIQGSFRDPSRLAYHKSGLPDLVLYKVRFRQLDVWGSYHGSPNDLIEADIYEPWLEKEQAST
jgi:hypothetical protein